MNKKKDPKYLGIPNICFSLTEKKDIRESLFIKQRLERGFDDSETWDLTSTITKFILPRLERYEEIIQEKIEVEDSFIEGIKKAKIAFNLILRDDGTWIFTEEEFKAISEGLEDFSKIFIKLWW